MCIKYQTKANFPFLFPTDGDHTLASSCVSVLGNHSITITLIPRGAHNTVTPSMQQFSKLHIRLKKQLTPEIQSIKSCMLLKVIILFFFNILLLTSERKVYK